MVLCNMQVPFKIEQLWHYSSLLRRPWIMVKGILPVERTSSSASHCSFSLEEEMPVNTIEYCFILWLMVWLDSLEPRNIIGKLKKNSDMEIWQQGSEQIFMNREKHDIYVPCEYSPMDDLGKGRFNNQVDRMTYSVDTSHPLSLDTPLFLQILSVLHFILFFRITIRCM